MPELGGNARFVEKLLHLPGAQLSAARDFERDRAIQLDITSFPNRTKAPHSQALKQLEMRDLRNRLLPLQFRIVACQAKPPVASQAWNLVQLLIGHDLERFVAQRAADLERA